MWMKEVQIITDHPSASLWALRPPSGLHVDLKSIENVCEFAMFATPSISDWIGCHQSLLIAFCVDRAKSCCCSCPRSVSLFSIALLFQFWHAEAHLTLDVVLSRCYTAQSPSGFKIDALQIRRFIFLQPLRFCFTSSSCADCQRQEVWSRPGTAFASVPLLHDPVRTDRVSPYESTQFGRVTAYLFSTVYRSLDLSI